ncbi:MAG: hypothetical protein ACTSU5_02190 [Promethearchaeota archaeon]
MPQSSTHNRLRLATPGLARACIKLALVAFVPGLVVAVLVAWALGGTATSPGEYTLVNYYISDLGSARCTPIPWLLDATLAVTAVAFVPTFAFAHRVTVLELEAQVSPKLPRLSRFACNAGTVFLYSGAAGMAGIAAFSLDRNPSGVHVVFATVTFVSFTAASFAYGFAVGVNETFVPRGLGVVMLAAPLVSILVYAANLLGGFLPEPLLEWAMLATVLWWILPVGVLMLRHVRRDAGGAWAWA